MKGNKYVLNTVLAVVLGMALLACVLIRTFAPAVIIPKMSIPNLALICLVTLLVDHYLTRGAQRNYLFVAVLAVVSFGLLPLAAGMAELAQAWKLALVGGGLFTVLTFLFTSVQDRLSSGPAAFAAPMLSAFGLYLAVQGLANILI
jgi:hypothetical protein